MALAKPAIFLGPSLAKAGVLFVCALAQAGGTPWWDAIGADPAWLFGGADSNVAEVRWENADWLHLRRPVDFRATSRARATSPCVRPTPGVEACAGVLWLDEQMDLESDSWRMEGLGELEASGMASLSLGPSPTRTRIWLEQGEKRRASGMHMGWGDRLWRVEIGAQRARVASRLGVRTSQGAIDLDWSDLTDSVWIGMELPLGDWKVNTNWWSGSRRAGELSGDHLTDTMGVSGWGVGAGRRVGAGRVEGRLWREDRHGIVSGLRGDDVFLDQVVAGARAELSLRWQGRAWELSGATRQWRLESPKGRLDHPTIHWNRLSQREFAPFMSLLEDRSDYLWGNLALEVWEAKVGRTFRVGEFTIHPRWLTQWIRMEAHLERTRLTVKTFLPSTVRDTLVLGAGWLALAGPRLSVERSIGWGRIRCWAEMRFPLAGEWNDGLSKSASSQPGPSQAQESLPIDPLGSWVWGGSWAF